MKQPSADAGVITYQMQKNILNDFNKLFSSIFPHYLLLFLDKF